VLPPSTMTSAVGSRETSPRKVAQDQCQNFHRPKEASAKPMMMNAQTISASLMNDVSASCTAFASLAYGNGTSGTGTSRILQSGSHPSLTSKKCSLLAGVMRRSQA
jgi:hypothetical protein